MVSAARNLGVAAQADGLLQELDGLQVLLPQVVRLGEHEEPLRSLRPGPRKPLMGSAPSDVVVAAG